ncbi:hypothetical protein IE53DRAFT_194422 [Violaceomyces palustris]|uniref:Uncharacterized protein n=1 Tax=Violaceomyces palustris TaxID=1673888 RepID=A0ACD0NRM0_9BASI|nr:hypothetical protein IE53DRAFT_194422 [Violaceomyces palustris]
MLIVRIHSSSISLALTASSPFLDLMARSPPAPSPLPRPFSLVLMFPAALKGLPNSSVQVDIASSLFPSRVSRWLWLSRRILFLDTFPSFSFPKCICGRPPSFIITCDCPNVKLLHSRYFILTSLPSLPSCPILLPHTSLYPCPLAPLLYSYFGPFVSHQSIPTRIHAKSFLPLPYP